MHGLCECGHECRHKGRVGIHRAGKLFSTNEDESGIDEKIFANV